MLYSNREEEEKKLPSRMLEKQEIFLIESKRKRKKENVQQTTFSPVDRNNQTSYDMHGQRGPIFGIHTHRVNIFRGGCFVNRGH